MLGMRKVAVIDVPLGAVYTPSTSRTGVAGVAGSAACQVACVELNGTTVAAIGVAPAMLTWTLTTAFAGELTKPQTIARCGAAWRTI